LVDTPYLQQFNWDNDPIPRIKESEIEFKRPPKVDLVEVKIYKNGYQPKPGGR